MGQNQKDYYIREKAKSKRIYYKKSYLMTMFGGEEEVIIQKLEILHRLKRDKEKVMYVGCFVKYKNKIVNINIH